MPGYQTRRGPSPAILAASLLVALAAPVSAQDAEPAPDRPATRKAPPRAAPVRKPTPAAAAKPPAPAKPAITVPAPSLSEMQPIQHASANGVSTCLNAVRKASAAIVDAPHKAKSFWVAADPNGHQFQSIIGLDYRTKAAPNGMAIIASTPTPERGCDSTSVQVVPSARSCQELRTDLLRDGSLTEELAGMPLIHSSNNFEHMLLPAPGNGCVIVAVGIGIEAPNQQAAQVPGQAPAPPPAPAASNPPDPPAPPAQQNR